MKRTSSSPSAFTSDSCSTCSNQSLTTRSGVSSSRSRYRPTSLSMASCRGIFFVSFTFIPFPEKGPPCPSRRSFSSTPRRHRHPPHHLPTLTGQQTLDVPVHLLELL